MEPTFNKDPELWELAKKRAGFKSHFITYLGMIPFFWLIWLLTGQEQTESGLPWPIWPTFGWGVGVLFHFWEYMFLHKYSLVESEYEKLVRDRKS
jgi:sterol desaturase/sphingolipid hydroxylase (fatty acid hydroxylase superfamily)